MEQEGTFQTWRNENTGHIDIPISEDDSEYYMNDNQLQQNGNVYPSYSNNYGFGTGESNITESDYSNFGNTNYNSMPSPRMVSKSVIDPSEKEEYSNNYGQMEDTRYMSYAPGINIHTHFKRIPSSTSFTSMNQRTKLTDQGKAMNDFRTFMQVLIALSCFALMCSLFLLGMQSFFINFALIICIFSFYFALWITKWILSKEECTAEMRRISDFIKEGSEGFLTIQYTAIAKYALVVACAILFIYMFREPPNKHVGSFTLAIVVSLSFLLGSLCSALAGYMGVWISVRVNIRTAVAASNKNYSDSFLLSFRGGAVSSILSASMCILGVTILYLLCYLIFVKYWEMPSNQLPVMLAGYGFGASFVALFMQLGGGIYTKAADVGADMVGKVERDIPEDDHRNPAVIADLVGDNVGDCAGSMADVFESIAGEIIGTMILGGALAAEAELPHYEPFIFFPLVIHAFDLLVSGVGIYFCNPSSENEDALNTMKRGYLISMTLAIIIFISTCRILLYVESVPEAWWHFALCGCVGIIASYLLILSTQYYTDYARRPVRSIAEASQTGHGTNVIAGISVGLRSTGFPILLISFALLISYTLGTLSGLPSRSAGVFGTAVSTMGMLCTAVFILSMNNFGPIADNAGGIVEMSGQSESARVITDKLDAVGNVTKAASKGYAVGGSALACFVLYQAFLDEISDFTGTSFNMVNIAKIEVVIGGLLGVMMIFIFTGWAIEGVGVAAQKVVWEVRRQFRENAGIMDGSQKPDYHTCVVIVTKAALKEMAKPAILALATPVCIGFFFKFYGAYTNQKMLGIEVCASFLMFATLTGLMMAIFMDNSGGAWDNAKKYIEATGGKHTDAHKAAVTGDTVGDPFKDTAGPALHVIITTMSTTILVLGISKN